MVDEDAVTGLTSNPSIFQKAIAGGGDYDEQISELPREHRRPARDLLRARDRRRPRRLRRAPPGLGPDRTAPTATSRSRSTPASPSTRRRPSSRRSTCTRGSSGRTSTSRSRRRARACRRSRSASPRGIPINVTLIFSLERYGEVVDAYQRGVARLVDERRRPVEGAPPSPRSSSRGSTPRPTPARGARRAPSSRASSGSRTRSSPTSTSARRSPAPSWERLAAAGRDASSGRSGPRPRPRTPPTATSCTSRS